MLEIPLLKGLSGENSRNARECLLMCSPERSEYVYWPAFGVKVKSCSTSDLIRRSSAGIRTITSEFVLEICFVPLLLKYRVQLFGNFRNLNEYVPTGAWLYDCNMIC
jgi:hypothetical protein